MRPLTLSRLLLRCGILTAILFVVVVIALKLGAVQVSLYGLGRDLIRVLLGQSAGISSDYGMIVVDIRLPRILLAIVVGASLSVAGASFQALLRNPLADPYVLGVSSGAAVGSIIALLVENQLSFSPAFAGMFTPLGASIGAGVAIAAVYFLGRRDGRIDSSTLLLSGIIASSFLSAIVMFLMSTLSGGNLRGYSYWLMGSFSTLPPKSLLYLLGIGFLVASGVIYTTASDLNLLLAADLRFGSAHAAAGIRARWRHRAGACGHGSAHGCRAIRSPSRSCHRRHWRSVLHLSAPQGAEMSSPLRTPVGADTPRSNPDIRLSVEQASYVYAPNPTQAPLFTLEVLSFQAKPAEIVAILGPNASGKSTLLKLISGALAPLSGRVFLNGSATHSLPPKTRAQRIALVQQESQLLFPSRVWEFVLQGRHSHSRGLHFESQEDVAIASNALAQVGAAHLTDRWMDKISGGEKQRVILARALAQQPLLLLLDEPTLHLDIGAQVDLLESLRKLAAQNRYTVVVVTHELNLAGEYADQVVLLQKGKCLRVGPPAAVYQRDLLEQVFQAPLSVEMTPSGRPRVTLFPDK